MVKIKSSNNGAQVILILYSFSWAFIYAKVFFNAFFYLFNEKVGFMNPFV